jgi:hypothetical protein
LKVARVGAVVGAAAAAAGLAGSGLLVCEKLAQADRPYPARSITRVSKQRLMHCL